MGIIQSTRSCGGVDAALRRKHQLRAERRRDATRPIKPTAAGIRETAAVDMGAA